jgi:8-amino-7-oxononanoate synthase
LHQGLEERISALLEQRREKGEYRRLRPPSGLIDFSSNDYLGLSRSAWIADRVQKTLEQGHYRTGSTGSRLLTGNSAELTALEEKIAGFHQAEAALLMNSGYAANEGLMATVCRAGDVILYDEAVHASIHQGMRLSKARSLAFGHNDMDQLRSRLMEVHAQDGVNAVFVVVESVYSMDGDHAPLGAIAALRSRFGFNLIVDEAHALGVFGKQGRGRCDLEGMTAECFARIYTFGKGLGYHGAAVVGSRELKEYLVNYCKPFIYSTAPDPRFTTTVEHSYDYLLKFDYQQIRIIYLINKFKKIFSAVNDYEMIGQGPVFGLVCGSPGRVRDTAAYLQEVGFDIRPIVYPTVPRGTERLRISLHSFNTSAELETLRDALLQYSA